MAQQQAEQRNDDHVQAGDEAGVGDAGEQQAHLLQVDPQRQGQAHQQAAQQQAAVERLLDRGPGQYQQQGQEDEGAEGEAQAGIEEGADRIHAQALGDEGRTPDGGGDQHQDIGAQCLASHGGSRREKPGTLPQSD
ncbi:hypothetical protein D3C71_1772210 [compost metagenome]